MLICFSYDSKKVVCLSVYPSSLKSQILMKSTLIDRLVGIGATQYSTTALVLSRWTLSIHRCNFTSPPSSKGQSRTDWRRTIANRRKIRVLLCTPGTLHQKNGAIKSTPYFPKQPNSRVIAKKETPPGIIRLADSRVDGDKLDSGSLLLGALVAALAEKNDIIPLVCAVFRTHKWR
jgi:hypothetical protein